MNSHNDNLAVSWLKEEEFPLWDGFVSRHPLGLIYHLSTWKKAIERAFRHIKGHFLTVRSRESGEIIAGMPVYVVRSWILGNRIVSIPYASICDPLVSCKKEYELMDPELVSFQKKTRSQYIELQSVKTTKIINQPNCLNSNQSIHNYLILNGDESNVLIKQFTYSTRRAIKKAETSNLHITNNHSTGSLSSFYRLFSNTRKRLGLPSIPYIFFQSISSTLPKESLDFIFASLNGEYIAAWMILNYNGVMHLECYGGDNVAYENGASYLLSWECIKYAISLGLKKVSFGRTDCWNEGLLKYKRRWATLEEPICYYNYSYKHNAPFSFKSVKGRQTTRLIFRHAPHSIRKAIASIIYRHNG